MQEGREPTNDDPRCSIQELFVFFYFVINQPQTDQAIPVNMNGISHLIKANKKFVDFVWISYSSYQGNQDFGTAVPLMNLHSIFWAKKKTVGNLSRNLFLHFSILKLFDRLEWVRHLKIDKIGVGRRLLLHLNMNLVQTKSKRSSNLTIPYFWKKEFSNYYIP